MRARRYGTEATFVDDLAPGEPAMLREMLLAAVAAAGVRVRDVVPAADTLVVTHDAAEVAAVSHLITDCSHRLEQLKLETTNDETPMLEIPVRYDGEDLRAVAESCSLSVNEVIALHAGAEYRAEFCGFAPGFAYLRGLPAVLHVPRRASPRTRVPAGAVAIAAEYSAVYPRESPGGWHLLGTTSLVMWDAARPAPALLVPGARVRFVEVK